MIFYKNEKKRIGGNYKLIMFLILFINSVNLMSSVTHNANLIERGQTASYIPFSGSAVWGGLIIILLYMNYKLFWIKEQGQNSFLPKKYEITPLTLTQVYGAKIRIMANAAAAYLICSVAGYYFILLAGGYPGYLLDYGKNVIEIAGTVLFFIGAIASFLLWNIWVYRRTEKEI